MSISQKELKKIKREYPEGSRVELVFMDCPGAPPVGTRGTVYTVDDVGGHVAVFWDDGTCLMAWRGQDVIKRVEE